MSVVQNLGMGKLENTLSNASTHVCYCSVILWKGSFSHCREARPTWPRDHKWDSGSAQGFQLPWPYEMVKCHVVSRDHIWMRHILGWHSAWTSTSFWPIHVMWFPTFLDLVFHIENKLSCSVFLVSLSLSLCLSFSLFVLTWLLALCYRITPEDAQGTISGDGTGVVYKGRDLLTVLSL